VKDLVGGTEEQAAIQSVMIPWVRKRSPLLLSTWPLKAFFIAFFPELEVVAYIQWNVGNWRWTKCLILL
jgi:hypothetical protein